MDSPYRPAIVPTFKLVIVAVVSLILFYGTTFTRVEVKRPYYEEKLSAARLMKRCMETLKEYRLKQGKIIDLVNDPNETGLIGEQYSLIRTDIGSLDAKLTTLNPNFAAVVVDMFRRLGLKEGDPIGVAFTGSMPGANLAVLCASKTLQLRPVIITSVGASMWGATDPEFTWLDMESLLYKKGIIPFKSVAASIGGGSDIGRRLSPLGRQLIREAIQRNQVEFIEVKNLTESINRRIQIYDRHLNSHRMKAFVNVGGGAAIIGHPINARMFKSGVIKRLEIGTYESVGVMAHYAEKGIPLIHILDINRIASLYELPIAPVPMPEPGTGKLFSEQRYNLKIAGFSFAIIILLNSILIYSTYKKIKFVYIPEKEEEEI